MISTSSTALIMVGQLDPRPYYVQIADAITAVIKAGKLKPGDQIPSELSLRQYYGVARGTASQAVALLVECGLVVTILQPGSFVRQGPGSDGGADAGTVDAGGTAWADSDPPVGGHGAAVQGG